jgi:HK97 gp10 family phage protein
MANVQIKITNIEEIRRAFNKAPALMTANLNLAIRKTVLSIQSKSMINTPVDTGRLRSSTRSIFGNLKGEVGTNTKYDIFVHDGTKYLKARPYLADAVKDSSIEIDLNFKTAVQATLDSIGRAV